MKWSKTDGDSDSLSSNISNISSSESSDYERTYEMREDDVKVRTTFIQNRFKQRKHSGIYCQEKYSGICQRKTSTKFEKFKLINLKNKYYNELRKLSIKKFKRKYRYHRSGYKLWNNKLRYRTLTNYHYQFKNIDINRRKKNH